jgi:hypothetical protein
MIDHGPAQSRPCSVSLHYTDKWAVACHKCDRSVLSVSNGRIDCWYRVNNGQHIPLSCKAHISGAFAHVFADTHRQSCTTAQAALVSSYLQCTVSARYFYIRIIFTKYPWTKYSTISKIIPAQKITANLVVLNLVVKMHNVRSRNYYIKSDSTSVWKLSDWSWPSSDWIHQYLLQGTVVLTSCLSPSVHTLAL